MPTLVAATQTFKLRDILKNPQKTQEKIEKFCEKYHNTMDISYRWEDVPDSVPVFVLHAKIKAASSKEIAKKASTLCFAGLGIKV
ncbi:hypothetical protein [Ralstonia phage RSP15]|uniref:hypothetical protein n=1 Tax=Ralstonia phage RSP15 TaxID=1785960 RepID=UPI00074D48CE|nr:hypothetical protein BH754_gp151 [Ralstonia phage RSP15]BAU40155.1 hypothetical protein [Ralstonia phage RSP15]